jgi:hypothetical protein
VSDTLLLYCILSFYTSSTLNHQLYLDCTIATPSSQELCIFWQVHTKHSHYVSKV